MVAKDGHDLLLADARAALIEDLVPLAALLTPNIPEAEVLSGVRVTSRKTMAEAADRMLALGASAVLVKGGHLPGDVVVDLLRTADGAQDWFESERIKTRATHGTGCTLASAIAQGIAEGFTLRDSVERARRYVREAMRRAPGFGQGFSPLNHAFPVQTPPPNGAS
jgi:hydroxymethylpyrimidine/phosphomethylpyrimidine kinase